MEVTTGELLPDQEVPLLKHRREMKRDAARRLWSAKREEVGGLRAAEVSPDPADRFASLTPAWGGSMK